MIEILLVEDQPIKAEKIKQALRANDQIEVEIIVAEGVVEARTELKSRRFDLMILDLHLPNRKGNEPEPNAGIALLESLDNGLNLPLYIIGMTSYDEILKVADQKFKDSLWALIKYDGSSNVWERQIQSKIQYLSDLKKNTSFASRRTYNYDLAILTAVKVEFDATRRISSSWDKLTLPGDPTVYHVSNIPLGRSRLKTILAMTPEMGMTASSLLSGKLIHNFSPKLLVMVGIAAGFSGELNLGDLIVADPSWDYSSGKRIRDKFGHRLLPDPRQQRANPDLLGIIQYLSSNKNLYQHIWGNWTRAKPRKLPQIFVGPLASGSSVVADRKISVEIKNQSRKALGIDMETYGVYYAAANSPQPRPMVISLKAVCDFADAKKNDRYQPFCAYFSIEIARLMLAEFFQQSG